MKIEHKGLGVKVELKELTQGDLERFYAKQREVGLEPDNISLPEFSGAVVKIASDLDFFDEHFEDIGDWKPAKTIFIKDELIKAIVEAVTIPPV